MEVLPCSGVCHVGESDCPKEGTEAALKYDGASSSVDNVDVQAADIGIDALGLNSGEPHQERDGVDNSVDEGLPESQYNGDALYDFEVGPQDSVDSEEDNLHSGDHSASPDLAPASGSSLLVTGTLESGVHANSVEGESSISEIEGLELDEPLAVWVKWRGKWQAGIRCARMDWPLSTLKAKPTHDRKKYLVIFFPRTRNYSWADVLLVRPINEFPQPIAYKTHKIGVKTVKDLSLARRFIMQKLAVSMLNILDQLHCEALVDTARDVMVLKEFAIEASRCKGYSDLGRMLLKLQNMIMNCCLNSSWLQNSLQSWVQQCQDANSAECIEKLKEELADSIVWNEVNLLANRAGQVELGYEWKNWKHEVMKWFSISHPLSACGSLNQSINDSPPTMEHQASRKRAKLEIRRAETNASHAENQSPGQPVAIEISTTFLNSYDTLNTESIDSEPLTNEVPMEDTAPASATGNLANKWDEIVVEAGNSDVIQTKAEEPTPASDVSMQKSLVLGNNSRQCIAFIEAKGRQCVRYANEGDVYCCVHLASRFASNSAKAEVTPPADSPMCEGTTVLGTKCKHRALLGFSFCKKHRPKDGTSIIPVSPVAKLKRKHEDGIIDSGHVSPGQVEPCSQGAPASFVQQGAAVSGSGLTGVLEQCQQEHNGDEMVQCIGSWPQEGSEPCPESAKRHSLYCEKHIPSWLKRARNGKSRIVSKEVFIELLKDCRSRDEKLNLHQACELFYKLFKSVLSLRNPVPKEVQFQWAISEASKDVRVGEFLMKLVRCEKERLRRVWGFSDNQDVPASSIKESVSVRAMLHHDIDHDNGNVIKCKICSGKFPDDQVLGAHWMDSHKKEAQWLFRGYVCAICLDSFTNKKVLETHVQERHHAQFVEHCVLLQCILCGSHFGNPEELWLHVLSVHPSNLRLPHAGKEQVEGSVQKHELNKSASMENINSENQSGRRRFICRFCGLRFDLLPDLGRHHQAAHMGQSSVGPRLTKKGIKFYAHKLKAGRLTRPRFKKALGSASYRIRSRSVHNLKKRIQASNPIIPTHIRAESGTAESASLGRLADLECSVVAKFLFSEIKKTKPRPSNSDILSVAQVACCKISLQASLEAKFGILPERMYLKAAKLCSEHNIKVEWHQEGFICPKGCRPFVGPQLLPLPVTILDSIEKPRPSISSNPATTEWTMDESHCIIDSRHFSQEAMEKNIILCDDISFGQESIPVACVVDENLLGSLHVDTDGSDTQTAEDSLPWEGFTYITKPLLDQSLVPEAESLQLGCACAHSICFSETCDHVYLFGVDYEDAKDMYGKPMHGRFPYDEMGRIILEEGYLVYECNQRCPCNKNCKNRVLQNGVQVKLEIFKTENKGWAVRTRESILRGTFVCEYIGEVIDEQEANRRRDRYGTDCRYLYEIDAHINDMRRLMEDHVSYAIDATKCGNVSRFINHSCSPNLVNHQVLVESMDSQLAHIGFFAIRDIAVGEELTYNFRYKLVPGEGHPCLCGASNCRGRLY